MKPASRPPATALAAGYRHLDSAQLYRNESKVGATLGETSIPWKEILVTTKQGVSGRSPEETYQLAVESVRRIAGDWERWVCRFVSGSDAALGCGCEKEDVGCVGEVA